MFDWLFYLNIPILYGVILLYMPIVDNPTLTNTELTGLTLSCGINVGHELGHRNSPAEQMMAQMLLLPALYMHFFIEHNRRPSPAGSHL